MEDIVNPVVCHTPQTEQTTSSLGKVSFQIGKHWFISDTKDIMSILPTTSLTPIPGVFSWVRGLLSSQGNIILAIDLEGFFNKKNMIINKNTRLLVANEPKFNTGFLVNNISNAVDISGHVIELTSDHKKNKYAPDVPKSYYQFISGITSGSVRNLIFNMRDLILYVKSLKLAKE